MTQQRQRRRPMSREEARAMEERRQRQKEKEQESRELARGPIDLPFLVLVLLLTGIGLVMLLSASFPSAYYETDGKNPMSYFIRQGVFAIMGLAAMLLIGKINYQRFRGLAQPLLFLSIILLVLVLIPHNPIAITRNHATRWLGIPGTSLQFQPSEVAKVAVVLYFSDSISKKKDRMRTFRYGILPYAIILVVLAALVGLEPHLSGAILIMGAGAVLMLVGGIHWGWVGGAAAAAVAAFPLFILQQIQSASLPFAYRMQEKDAHSRRVYTRRAAIPSCFSTCRLRSAGRKARRARRIRSCSAAMRPAAPDA